ncbi:hypothetical protein [Methanocella paludicola]|nr:hypothetical protein [Methanocella paludicola]
MTITDGVWAKEDEVNFFNTSLSVAPKGKLFYLTNDGRYLAYWPKNYRGTKTTLQSRNGRIGEYTEKWSKDLIEPIARELGFYAVNNVICDEVGLSNDSPADVAICRNSNTRQRPENIIAIFEVKMSIVWNWQCMQNGTTYQLQCLGDYNSHIGTPGLLRSDTMLKAIGKSVGIRTASGRASIIPIIILGNTPIQESYKTKVDNLKSYGIIQGFWSLNPHPLDNGNYIHNTDGFGFKTISSITELRNNIAALLNNNSTFFAGWKSKEDLGRMIELADSEITYRLKAERFLQLINGG